MSVLALILIAKMSVTLLAVVIPFLFFPKPTLDRTVGFGAPDGVFYRLYGVAVLALLVAYGVGYVQVQEGIYPEGVVWMGLVSNGGATLVLILMGQARKTPVFTAFFAAIAVGFAAAVLQPAAVMAPLF